LGSEESAKAGSGLLPGCFALMFIARQDADFSGQSAKAVANDAGDWSVDLPAMEASAEGAELSVSDGRITLQFKDVLVGEVRFASGHSNINWPLKRFDPDRKAIRSADYPIIRFFHAGQVADSSPRTDAEGQWIACTPAPRHLRPSKFTIHQSACSLRTGTFPGPGVLWDTITGFELQYQYANGVQLDYKIDQPYLRVEGDEGWIQAHWHSRGGLQAHDRKILTTPLCDTDTQVPTRSDKQDFISAITEGTPVMIDAEAGHRVNTQCLLGRAAIKLGKNLDWDPASEIATNDANALATMKGTYRAPSGSTAWPCHTRKRRERKRVNGR